MNQHPTPPAPAPAPPMVVVQTIADIFNHTTSIFSIPKNLHIFLLLSFIFFSLRFSIDLTTQALTSYIDNNPSIEAFFSPIPQSPPKSTPPTTTIRQDDNINHQFFSGSLSNPQSNATSFILDSSNPQLDNGFRASEILRSNSKFTFKSIQNDIVSEETNDSASINEVLFPFGVYIVSYCFLMFAYAVIQSFIHGVIFVLLLNHFCGRRHNSLAKVFKNGFRLGFMRSYDIILMRCTVRLGITLFLCLWFFTGIEDEYSIIKILGREVLMPYSIFTPSVKGYEVESQGLIIPWLIVDFLISFLLTLDPWIVMGDPTRNLKQAVEEGWNLLWLMFLPGFMLKCYENVVCGPFGKWVLARKVGGLFAIAIQAFMEVYYLVAWLMYYLSVMPIDANARGQAFGQPQLEAMLGVGGGG